MSLLSSFRTRGCAWQPVRVQRLNSFPLTFPSVIFSSSTDFLVSLMSKLDMLLVNASLKNSLRASVSSLSFVALPVSMSKSAIQDFAFSLLLKLRIALEAPCSLFCQGASTCLRCFTTLPPCLVPSLKPVFHGACFGAVSALTLYAPYPRRRG